MGILGGNSTSTNNRKSFVKKIHDTIENNLLTEDAKKELALEAEKLGIDNIEFNNIVVSETKDVIEQNREIFEEAVYDAVRDGQLTDKEMSMLHRKAKELMVNDDEVDSIISNELKSRREFENLIKKSSTSSTVVSATTSTFHNSKSVMVIGANGKQFKISTTGDGRLCNAQGVIIDKNNTSAATLEKIISSFMIEYNTVYQVAEDGVLRYTGNCKP